MSIGWNISFPVNLVKLKVPFLTRSDLWELSHRWFRAPDLSSRCRAHFFIIILCLTQYKEEPGCDLAPANAITAQKVMLQTEANLGLSFWNPTNLVVHFKSQPASMLIWVEKNGAIRSKKGQTKLPLSRFLISIWCLICSDKLHQFSRIHDPTNWSQCIECLALNVAEWSDSAPTSHYHL